jgi:Tol biopolymer transport system component
MPGVIRRVVGAGILALLLAASVASAVAPEGPRLAVIRFDAKPLRLELLTVDSSGALPVRLAGGSRRSGPLPHFFSPLSWSPDGNQIAFSAFVARGGQEREGRLRIFTVDADGSDLRALPLTKGAYGPVFSPDGRSLAFTRFRQRPYVVVNGKVKQRGFQGAAIWILDLATGTARQLTPWRYGLEYFSSSFSPDGSTLLATRLDDRRADEFEPVALSVATGGATRLFADGLSPVYSPDGSRVVVVRETAGEDTDLYTVGADGTGVRRLTRTPDRDEFFASWDPSGERLAYMRFSGGNSEAASEGIGDALLQVNADGTCQTKLLSARGVGFYVPAWQPGPGREAGRIEC